MNDPAPPAKPDHPGPGRTSLRRTRRPPGRSLALLASGALVAALTVAGCSDAGSDSSSPTYERQQHVPEAPEAPRRNEAGGEAADSATDSKAGDRRPGEQDGGSTASKPPKLASEDVVRTARLTVRVKDVPSALDDTRTTVENAGGYVGDETTSRDDENHERSHLVLRVPQEEYADVLEELSGSGKLIERKVTADDVTDQVVDVKSRVASQKASVERVRELMDKATELSDIVSLEGQLSTRQAELESLKARQASLEDSTALATITLVLSETEVKKEKNDETGFTDALGGGWGAFVTTMRWLAVAVGAVLPFLAALAVLLTAWKLTRNRLPRRLRHTPRPAPLSADTADGRSPAPAPAEPKSD